MANEKKTILRTVRIEPSLNEKLETIANLENRTVSNTIYNLVRFAIEQYYDSDYFTTPE